MCKMLISFFYLGNISSNFWRRRPFCSQTLRLSVERDNLTTTSPRVAERRVVCMPQDMIQRKKRTETKAEPLRNQLEGDNIVYVGMSQDSNTYSVPAKWQITRDIRWRHTINTAKDEDESECKKSKVKRGTMSSTDEFDDSSDGLRRRILHDFPTKSSGKKRKSGSHLTCRRKWRRQFVIQ